MSEDRISLVFLIAHIDCSLEGFLGWTDPMRVFVDPQVGHMLQTDPRLIFFVQKLLVRIQLTFPEGADRNRLRKQWRI